MTEQLGFDAMPQRLFSCTPSRLTSWLDCPRHYRMKYVDRPRPQAGPPWAHNSLGASVHNALANWWRLPRARRSPAAAGELVESGWLSDGFRDDEQSAQWCGRARQMVERYVAELDPDDEPLGVERTLAARTRRLALSGRVDRLDDRGGELVVVDYKTGRRPLTTDDARGSMALAIYAFTAGRTLRRPCTRVELHHLPTGDVVGWEHTEDSLERQLRRGEAIADEIVAAAAAAAAAGDAPGAVAAGDAPSAVAAGDAPGAVAAGDAPAAVADPYPARPGQQCGWCSMRAHCAEGQRAAPARDPWDALADPTS